MKNKQIINILILVGLLSSCGIFKKNTNMNNNTNTIYISQNGKERMMTNEIEVERTKFSLQFFNKKYDSEKNEFNSVKIASFLDLKELEKVQKAKNTSELECFELGSGMAPSRSGKYESLIFNNSGCHYLIYKNKESKRLNLIEDLGNILKLEFEIKSLYYNGKEEKMSETSLKEFYLAIFIDRNLNDIIDKDELYKVKIKIK